MVKLFPASARTEFVDLVCTGTGLRDAAAAVGASVSSATKWWAQSGGVKPKRGNSNTGVDDPWVRAGEPGDRFLTLAERAMIQFGRRRGLSYAEIGAEIGRNKSSVWREVQRNTSPDGVYYAQVAHTKAHQTARRPKALKLVEDESLCRLIVYWMDDGWSPKLISLMLAFYFPDDETMQVSHETIYQALYVQTRGNLRADLAEKLSLKRTKRVPHSRDRKRNSPYKDAFKISDRPPEVADRAVPGHWEGDLILSGDGASAIGTLVERTSRFTILLHLPGRHTADEVATAMIREMGTPSRAPAALGDLGPRRGTGRLRPHPDSLGHDLVLLRPALALAAGHEREHEPAAPLLVRERLRPLRPHRRGPPPDRSDPQPPAPPHPWPQDPSQPAGPAAQNGSLTPRVASTT